MLLFYAHIQFVTLVFYPCGIIRCVCLCSCSLLQCSRFLSQSTPLSRVSHSTRLSSASALALLCLSHKISSAPPYRPTGNPQFLLYFSWLSRWSNQPVWYLAHVKITPYFWFFLFSRSQQAFMQNSLSQPSPMMLSGTTLHSYPGVQPPELAKPQSSLAFQQTSNTQHIPILFEPQLNQPSGIGGSQLIDTHILQVKINSHTETLNISSSGFSRNSGIQVRNVVFSYVAACCFMLHYDYVTASGNESAFKSVFRTSATACTKQLLQLDTESQLCTTTGIHIACVNLVSATCT